MKSRRKQLNQQQTELRRLLTNPESREQGLALFFQQHATLHSKAMATAEWSYEDELFEDMNEGAIRRIPTGAEHSVAWCIWHIARIEDVAMNMLVAGREQVFPGSNWPERLKAPKVDTGNALDEADMVEFSAEVDIPALRAYRLAVGRRTQEIVQQLEPGALGQKVDPARLQRVRDAGVIAEASSAIIEYWERRTIAGLLLMPATRHSLVHLNEAWRLKERKR